ncbi:hypothetical protein QN277_022983 [Acacia crassicarpa]|uniref:Fe2OG dioxygenase domain-containing protein n=1 Tax=Acacia crassicarpa TaxID=499986 RepID=A0AAE1KCF0_9FABA|nr:hypothetical protein QN277_022983 [Acacia crassicarpa]
MSSQVAFQIPVIDFTDENLKPGTQPWFSASQLVRSALEVNGCFCVKSNKIPMEICNSVFALSKEVFDLPLHTKKQKVSDKPNHGYVGGNPRVPLYETMGIDLDSPSNEEAIQKFANIMWPSGNDHFCEKINLYVKFLEEMDQTAKRLLFDAYGLAKKSCDSLLESTNYLFRGFKYSAPQKTESNIGLIPHTDSTYFTILQQNNVAGLEVKLKNGEWITIDPSPSLFIILAGDAFKVWSNGRITACEHKVIIREEKERYSIGLSSFNSKMVETLEELIDEDHPRLYRAFDHYEFVAFRTTVKSPTEISKFYLL